MTKAMSLVTDIIDEIDKVIHGKREEITLILATWLAGGHVLLEDLPGTGKTMLAKTLAKVLELDFKRVQFTPDLLPTDVTGGLILDPGQKLLILRKGPVFSTIFLGDEINRATPRTQAALLEAMAEGQVTIDGNSHDLDPLFFVMATQNPIEQHGTFPLPEAQLDRFMIKLSLGYPDRKEEMKMIKARIGNTPLEKVNCVASRKQLEQLRELNHKIDVHESIYDYVLDLVNATRKHPSISMGASPRATLYLINLARAYSVISGQTYLLPATIHKIFKSVMSHRMKLKPEAKFEGSKINDIIVEILSSVKAPVIK